MSMLSAFVVGILGRVSRRDTVPCTGHTGAKALHPAAAALGSCQRRLKFSRPIRSGRLLPAGVGELCVGATRASRMNRRLYIALCLLLAGCSKASAPRSPTPTQPLTGVVIGGVYAVPSYVPDDPYWSIWKVVAEDKGKVWYMCFTNRFSAKSVYSRPPELFALNTLGQQGSNWGASMKRTKEFLSSPVIHYLGQ